MAIGLEGVAEPPRRSWVVSDLIDQLEPDSWRQTTPFAPEMGACHRVLFAAGSSRQEMIDAISNWLAEHQPCLFGRMEAKQRRLAFCVLTENDLARSDQYIRARIAEDRTEWKRLASLGESHGFLIVALSERIAQAKLGPTLQRLASRLCELYLNDGRSDEILHDDVLLGFKIGTQVEWRKWKVGVNYFSAQGDGRWWRDHRVPGGIAFSMNSVGHMARHRAETAIARSTELARKAAAIPREKLVYFALVNAMKTIGVPTAGSTRGTWLGKHGTFPEDKEPPPYTERPRYFEDLAEFSENRYFGHYHTDQTIPSDYFDERLWRKEELKVLDKLYFTYLHSLADMDYLSMGIGNLWEPDADGQTVAEGTSGREQ